MLREPQCLDDCIVLMENENLKKAVGKYDRQSFFDS